MAEPDDKQYEYRQFLVAALERSQTEYDKAVISLSSGALGISFAFIKDFIKDQPQSTEYLYAAWIMWALSICIVLISYYSSSLSSDTLIRKIDETISKVEIYSNDTTPDKPKRWTSIKIRITKILNLLSGVFFILGIASLIFFINKNLQAGIYGKETHKINPTQIKTDTIQTKTQTNK